MIETEGKRRNRIDLKELEKNNALLDYDELMRQLKKELGQTYFALAKIQNVNQKLNKDIDLFSQMNQQYQKQANLNNVPKADFYRLQTELIALQKDQIELQNDETELLTKLRILTQNNDLAVDEIDFSIFDNSARE